MSDFTNDLPTRAAILEEIARGTKAALERIERRLDDHYAELRSLRSETATELRSLRSETTTELRSLRSDMRSDFRWTLGVLIGLAGALLGVMAHGFHWL